MIPIGVIHGRFQPLHDDHLKYLLAGKKQCRHLVIGITNPDPVRSKADPADPTRHRADANPLTYYERYVMLRAALSESGLPPKDFSVVPLPINFPELIAHYVPTDAVFFLTIYDDWGKKKQELFRSLDLQTHVLWEKTAAEKGISAATVRDRLQKKQPIAHLVPPAVARLLAAWDIAARLA
jgi:nicotinamide-nucleotide adenylyltransferase